MYVNSMPYYPHNMRFNTNQLRQDPNNRFGGFLLPFALGFVSSPLIFGATRPRPMPYYPAPYNPGGYFPYY